MSVILYFNLLSNYCVCFLLVETYSAESHESGSYLQLAMGHVVPSGTQPLLAIKTVPYF